MEWIVYCTPYLKGIGILWSECKEQRFENETQAKKYMENFKDTEDMKYILNINKVEERNEIDKMILNLSK